MAIYARLENGTYAEVTGVYKTDGTEVTEIFQGDRLVYSATNEIYGSLPIYYNGKGYDLTDYLISGNAVQDGTPSADAPVDAQGSGVRTGNLFDKEKTEAGKWLTENGSEAATSTLYHLSEYIKISPNTEYTFGARGTSRTKFYNENKEAISETGWDLPVSGAYTAVSPSNAFFVRVTVTTPLLDTFQINLGSTALPYEPYGFKLPLTVNGTEYPIYLGTVPATRRVKKLVLTGEETWQHYSAPSGVYGIWQFYVDAVVEGLPLSSARSNIADYGVTATTRGSYPYGVYLVTNGTGVAFQMAGAKDKFRNVTAWKAYLAAQYAAGTPVAVWYVLAEPETGIVNEPLMKIGDYADTVSFAQAGVTIPTVNGANVLNMASTVKPSEVYIKGKGIKPTGYGRLTDVNGVDILGKDDRPIYVHGQ